MVAWDLEGPQRPEVLAPAGEADLLLRRVVAEFCTVDRADVHVSRLCPRCGSSDHGRPHVTVVGHVAPHVSLSRADGLVCVAVTDAGPVGVDCERVGAAEFTDFATVGLHPLEGQIAGHDQTITWVRKESLVKATGDGLTVDLRQVQLAEPGESPRLLGWDGPHPPAGPVWMRDVVGPPGYVVAVTVLSGVEPELTALAAAEQLVEGRPAADWTQAGQLAAQRRPATPSATAHRVAGPATAGRPTTR